MAIHCDGGLVITHPIGLNESLIEKVIIEKAGWIIKKLEHFKKVKPNYLLGSNNPSYAQSKARAKKFIMERLKHLNQTYNFKYNKICIRNQKTRWGSCSRNGNLNFNYKLLFLSIQTVDYIIAHELCHLKEFNHSRAFWSLVAQAIPEYGKIRKQLKNGF